MYFLSNLIRFPIYIALYGILSVCSLQRVKVLFIFGLLYCLHLTTRLRPYISLSSQRYFFFERDSFFQSNFTCLYSFQMGFFVFFIDFKWLLYSVYFLVFSFIYFFSFFFILSIWWHFLFIGNIKWRQISHCACVHYCILDSWIGYILLAWRPFQWIFVVCIVNSSHWKEGYL